MNRKLIAIVPAAGVGSRAETAMPKQYQAIHGQPMLRLAVNALLVDARIHQVRVAVSAGDTQVDAALQGLPRTVWRDCGGATRAATVAAALADAGLDDHDWVLVHDAARPGLPASALARLIATCLDTGQGGLLAVRVADTVKRESPVHDDATNTPESGSRFDLAQTESLRQTGLLPDAASRATPAVLTSVRRDGLWLAQTPQMFPAGLLRRALAEAMRAGHEITDEASAVELTGYAPLLIPGSMRNFKVTWPEDVDLMAKWL